MANEQKIGEKRMSRSRQRLRQWKSVLGGDILATDFFRRQTKLIGLVMLFTILYVDNRYSCQRQLIELAQLQQELADIRYNALTRSSELMQKSRQSNIERYINANGSELHTSTQPPSLSPIRILKRHGSKQKKHINPILLHLGHDGYHWCGRGGQGGYHHVSGA